jgi:hypothetical protein
VLHASFFSGTAVKTRCEPSGENVKSSPLENVVLVGYASRSPGVTSRQSEPSALQTNRCCRLSSTYSTQWR